MKRIRWLALCCFLTACLLGTAAQALDAGAEFDGYLARIDADAPVRLLSASEPDFPDMEEVYAPAGVYKVEDADALDALRDSGLLISAEPNYIVTLDDTPSASDESAPPFSDEAEAALLDASEEQWYADALELGWVRGQGFRGAGVRVGVVDSGIFREHEEFQGVKILEGANYCVSTNDTARKDVSDSVGHGTFVSGLIAAAENGAGIAGLAPDVELVPLKCFEGKNGNVANIAAAIYDAVDTWHCDVLNLSLGLEKESATLKAAIDYAGNAGVVMVAAAGNLTSGSHSANGDPLNYPAAYPQVIGVGALNSSLSVASFSYRNKSVEIAAPGQSLRGPSTTKATGYVTGYGTSYASPMVAAAAALALSARPGLTAAEIRDLLIHTAHDAGETGYDTAYGYGILHLGHTLAAASGNLLHQAEIIRERTAADADGATPGLFAAAYDADGGFLALRDISPLSPSEREPDATPILASTDANAPTEETFQVTGAALWKLFPLDRFTFAPAGASAQLYG